MDSWQRLQQASTHTLRTSLTTCAVLCLFKGLRQNADSLDVAMGLVLRRVSCDADADGDDDEETGCVAADVDDGEDDDPYAGDHDGDDGEGDEENGGDAPDDVDDADEEDADQLWMHTHADPIWHNNQEAHVACMRSSCFACGGAQCTQFLHPIPSKSLMISTFIIIRFWLHSPTGPIGGAL